MNGKEIERTFIKKANQIVSFKFGNFQFLDFMNIPGAATSPNSFLEAYKTNDTKSFIPYEWFDSTDKLKDQPFPSLDDFFGSTK